MKTNALGVTSDRVMSTNMLRTGSKSYKSWKEEGEGQRILCREGEMAKCSFSFCSACERYSRKDCVGGANFFF